MVIITRADIESALGPLAYIIPHTSLNEIQSACFQSLLYTDTNMVIAAPTGSGKTLLMELALLRLFAAVRPGQFKAVYISPIKALAQEKATCWEKKFSRMNLSVLLETGDTDMFDTLFDREDCEDGVTLYFHQGGPCRVKLLERHNNASLLFCKAVSYTHLTLPTNREV